LSELDEEFDIDGNQFGMTSSRKSSDLAILLSSESPQMPGQHTSNYLIAKPRLAIFAGRLANVDPSPINPIEDCGVDDYHLWTSEVIFEVVLGFFNVRFEVEL
jgi:hypothetical protein